MTNQRKFILVFILGLTISLMGLVGCASQKKAVVEQKPAPVEQKQTPREPEKKPAPQPQVREVTQTVERAEEKPAVPNDLKFGSVYFDFDTSDIRSDQQPTLRNNAQLLSQYTTVTIRIEGHCDERGTNEYNQALGQRRADAVKTYLIDYGIDRSRISTVSYGEERAVDNGHNESAWVKNRRDEFTIVSTR